MAQAVFHTDFNHTPPRKGMSWRVKASDQPQTFPRHVIDAAVAAGVATEQKPRRAKKDLAKD